VLKGLRVFVLLLLGTICYQVGYRSGYGEGQWHESRHQQRRAAEALNDHPPDVDTSGCRPDAVLARSSDESRPAECTVTATVQPVLLNPDDEAPATPDAHVVFNSDSDPASERN
jgi:hypothetical protein